MAQFKEQIKALKIELTDEEIANLSDTEFKTLVIRMFTEMIEDGCKIEAVSYTHLRAHETQEVISYAVFCLNAYFFLLLQSFI